ncbi:hypothetical protein AN958_11071 [Leucoagaricus sp. SymC.cos]|nr:hypothetical protein AN958_11071 [Leucoagaricus sp. SymC.cos]
MPASAFSKKALPLHVNLTHTPPKLPDEGEEVVPDDPGYICTMTLIPCVHPTGGYGWHGKGMVRVGLLDVEKGEERKQVEVVLSVDAVVVDSKDPTPSAGQAVTEADGGTEGYESDNDSSL